MSKLWYGHFDSTPEDERELLADVNKRKEPENKKTAKSRKKPRKTMINTGLAAFLFPQSCHSLVGTFLGRNGPLGGLGCDLNIWPLNEFKKIHKCLKAALNLV